ncbi:MAG: hypothetical protein J7K04_09290 [Spirochaetales bacterium]|nr:hypothetical protein [Spirochaetales bacterium]
MKTAKVRFTDIEKPISEKSVSGALERITEVYSIDEIPWKDYPYRPQVTFKIAWTEKGLLLQYNVREEYIRAVYSKTNDPVYEDSCVEFFLSAGKNSYYNFEFNCIGTALVGFGTSRQDRKWIASKNIEHIKRFSSLGREPFKEKKGPYMWRLSIYVPFLFFEESLKELDELYNFPRAKANSFRANLYKCGDKLSIPHYAAWNRIKTKSPDFHRPEYFGKLVFME